MKLHASADLCQGHNNCIRIAPQLFQLDVSGYASARLAAIPVALESLAELAADNCPECAIEIIREAVREVGNGQR
ncbi:ferredoxin [Variovorax sp. GT1P44]|uniref:ferredoxin n=1 Tax=Variovorax sp. GT1P44 TaxID=3443742 RepID=UPI003F44FD9C